jgi:hypothetical protein
LLSRFFSNRDVGQDAQLETLERQQALLLEALRRAGGAPVTYADLRDAGIEFPASVVSELELAGVSIARCYETADGARRVLGVRLEADSDWNAARAAAATDGAARADDVAAREHAVASTLVAGRAWSSGPVGAGRWLVPSALVATVVVVVALVVAALGDDADHDRHTLAGSSASTRPVRRHQATPTRQSRRGALASATSTPATGVVSASSTATPTPRPRSTPAVPVSTTLAARLESQGHELLQEGSYGEAVPVLERALAATGESVGACVQPASERCLTYAYALYDLGRALMLSGSTAAAVSVLKHRLQIENQRPVVAAELESARRELG